MAPSRDAATGWNGRVLSKPPILIHGIARHAHTFTAPTIYILGGKSTIVPANTPQELKKLLRDCKIVTMHGLGHYPDVKPSRLLAIADRFLSRKSS